MLDTTANFLETLKMNNWKSKEIQELEDGKDHVCCGVNGKMTQVDFHFFFDQDGHAFTMRIFKLFAIPIDKRLQIMELMNTVNKEYRWIKFFIDEENWMNVQADAVANGENAGKIGMELLLRSMNIIDSVYPRFMHEIWA